MVVGINGNIALVSILPALLATAASASLPHWSEVDREPVCVFIGTVTRVEHGSWEKPTNDTVGNTGSRVVSVFDTGTVAVDSLLVGDGSTCSFELTWLADARLEPPLDRGDASSSLERHFEVGDRRIWVIWPLDPDATGFLADHQEFQAYGLRFLERELAHVEEYKAEISARVLDE